MPDVPLADGLIGSARLLCSGGGRGKPKQADLRRAVSSAYYAVFHALARTCADVLIGKTKSRRPNKAWVEVYRGLDHGIVKNACEAASRVAFPQEIQDFADAFHQLQMARLGADYDPMVRVSKTEAIGYIVLAEDSIAALEAAPYNDKLAFAAWVLIATKGAKAARVRAKGGDTRTLSVGTGQAP